MIVDPTADAMRITIDLDAASGLDVLVRVSARGACVVDDRPFASDEEMFDFARGELPRLRPEDF